ncbi:hypothetical protein NP233_g4365 [Leucocoprinus birnbaumii]|uniref:MI domain-containing protein n=1 Tax=Leucocoprinus birnbaumii TaxID=56174 RepID=A0AAD5YXA4_9AGAR|nr:hypothetical protein NP233_g4365 [Leucocoprinus birnbaumii]
MPMFNGARDFKATGPFVEVNEVSYGRSGFDKLFDHSSPHAAWDSVVTESKASCLKGTRTQYIEDLTGWGTGTDTTQRHRHRVLWMYGYAGVGKSAVAKSCARNISKRKRLCGSFFFSRDKRVNDPMRLFPTIASQIAADSMEYKAIVGTTIENDPGLLYKGLKAQFEALIIAPFLQLHEQGLLASIPQKVAIIDGLDECDGDAERQAEIVDIIASTALQHASKVPLLWAIFSRPEHHIVRAFSEFSDPSLLWKVELPVSRDYDGDIMLYFRNALHPLPSSASSVQIGWPSEDELGLLVRMVAGLFIYAATVARFIMSPYSLQSPQQQLTSVLEFYSRSQARSPRSTESSAGQSDITSELDNFYSMIMARVPTEFLPTVQQILLIHRSSSSPPIRIIANHLGITLPVLVERCLLSLHSVLTIDPRVSEAYLESINNSDRKKWLYYDDFEALRGGTISVYHASFFEYLTDANRSKQYWIEKPSLYTEIASKGIQLRNALYAMNGTSRRMLLSVTYDDAWTMIRMELGEKISKLRKMLLPDSPPHGLFTATQCLEYRDELLLEYLENWILFWWISSKFESKTLESLIKADLNDFQRTPLRKGLDLQHSEALESLLSEDWDIVNKNTRDPYSWLSRWPDTKLPYKPESSLQDKPSKPPASAPIEDIWAYIQSTFFTYRDILKADDVARLFGEMCQDPSKVLFTTKHLDDLDDYDLFSYYVQQWDMYYKGRNLQYLGYDDRRHIPLAISQAAFKPWEEFFIFMQGPKHRLTKAFLGTWRRQCNGDVLWHKPRFDSYSHWVQNKASRTTTYEDHFMTEYRRMMVEFTVTDPVFGLSHDLRFNLKDIRGRSGEEFRNEDIYGLCACFRTEAICKDVLMKGRWDEMYSQFEKLLRADANDDATMDYLHTIKMISNRYPGALDRIDEIFKANVRRLATAAIGEITSRGGQDSENADVHTALLFDLSVRQDKMMEGIIGGGPSMEGQLHYKVVDDAFHELVSDLPEWRDVVDSVCAQREQQRERRRIWWNPMPKTPESDTDGSLEELQSTPQEEQILLNDSPVLSHSLQQLEHTENGILARADQNSNKNGRTAKKSRKQSLSRKEARKQGRTDQKQKKAQFFSVSRKRRVQDEAHDESPPQKRSRTEKTTSEVNSHAKLESTFNNTTSHGHAKSRDENSDKGTEHKRTQQSQSATDRKGKGKEKIVSVAPPRSRVEEEEDAYITYLEKRLGYGKGKQKKSSSLEEDGLDDLLDWADSLAFPTASVHDEDPESDRDQESDLGLESDSFEDTEDEGEGNGAEGEEEWEGIASSSDAELDVEEEGTLNGQEIEGNSNAQPQAEAAASATRYIPPHLRKKQDEPESEAIARLKKQLKGLLNRMSEQNLASIIDSIEELYRNNRRHDVTSGITNLVIEGISSHSILLDSYVVLHAALISSLHKIIGVEFAAYFLQNVVKDYERHHHELANSDSTTPVISSVLVFDLVRQLLEGDLTEFNVELLLKLMRNSGQQLRQDDPSALKDIVDIVQKKVAGRDERSLSSRTRFMIETLVNLKNNKLKRNTTQNQGVLAHDALRVSLEDLHSAESKGKWWLVGAAWGGNPLVEAQENMANVQVNGQATTMVSDPTSDLLKLARKQGMNTDIRRSIFVVLMSSDDYVDACERLSQLNLTEVQQREIVRVLLHCCGNEKTYNPYYALVCQQLCRQSHSYKITLQFCLWDFLRDLGEVTVGGAEVVKNAKDDDNGFDLKKISSSRIRNVAKAYAWWIAKDVVNLSILKAVDFTILKSQTQQFLRELLLQTMISSQSATPLIDTTQLPTTHNRAAIEEIFVKATRIENLVMGLVYFLANVFSRHSYDDDQIATFVKWASGLALDTLRAGVDVIPSL